MTATLLQDMVFKGAKGEMLYCKKGDLVQIDAFVTTINGARGVILKPNQVENITL